MEKKSDQDLERLAKADAKRKAKAVKVLEENRSIEIKPTGTERARVFSRVSKGGQKLFARQYMQHKKSGAIVKVEVNQK